jgi:hypothetical protein
VDKLRLEMTVPAQKSTGLSSVRIQNTSDHKLKVRVVPLNWTLNEDGKLVQSNEPINPAIIPNDFPLFNVVDKIKITPEEFSIEPRETKLVRFGVKLPSDATDGEYHLQLFYKVITPPIPLESPSTDKQETPRVSATISTGYVTTVYVYKGQHLLPKPSIMSSDWAYNKSENHLMGTCELKNEGNQHARLIPKFILSEKSNKGSWHPVNVGTLKNSKLLVVLPGNRRKVVDTIEFDKKNTLKPGHYQLEFQLLDERHNLPALSSVSELTIP